MSEATVTLLGFAVLASLYAFFAWALWTSNNQLRPTATPEPRREQRPVAANGPIGRITVLEPPDLAGLVFDLGDELTIGRAAACRLTLDDTYVSQHLSLIHI